MNKTVGPSTSAGPKPGDHLGKAQSAPAIMAEARGTIRETIEGHERGARSYSHNIIGLVLASVAKRLGYARANELVREFNLDRRFGIHEVHE